MAEFSAAASLEVSVDQQSLRSARRQIENDLGDVSVGMAPTGGQSRNPQTGQFMSQEGSEQRLVGLTDLAQERNDLLEDLADMGLGGGGGGGGSTNVFPVGDPRGLLRRLGGFAGGVAGAARGGLSGLARGVGMGSSVLQPFGIPSNILAQAEQMGLTDILPDGQQGGGAGLASATLGFSDLLQNPPELQLPEGQFPPQLQLPEAEFPPQLELPQQDFPPELQVGQNIDQIPDTIGFDVPQELEQLAGGQLDVGGALDLNANLDLGIPSSGELQREVERIVQREFDNLVRTLDQQIDLNNLLG